MLRLGHDVPRIAPSAWVAPGATAVGDVVIGERSTVWYASVLRGDCDQVWIGAGSNIQDGAVLHCAPGQPVRLGDGVSVGHRAVVHACTVGDHSLVGMGAVLLSGSTVGVGCVVAAGSLVPEGAVIPDGTLAMGVPARVRRRLSDAERAAIRDDALTYVALGEAHRAAAPVEETPATAADAGARA